MEFYNDGGNSKEKSVQACENMLMYKFFMDNTRDIMLVAKLDGTILKASNSAVAVYGYERNELLGMKIKDLYGKNCPAPKLSNKVSAEKTALHETLHRRKDGSEVPVEVICQTIQNGTDDVLGVIVRDISERRQLEAKLRYLATYDCLTNIPNRKYLEKALMDVLADPHKSEKGALMFIDLDNFKFINDMYGYAEGDRLLIDIAAFLKANLRECDVLARLGSDEFAVLLDGVSAQEARAIAERLRSALDENRFLFRLHNGYSNVTASIGVIKLDGGIGPHKALSCANAALFAAKDEGKNRVVLIGSEREKRQFFAINSVINQIRGALQHNRFILHFQPVYRLGNGILHYEALIRMKGENGEIIFPGSFIPVAERYGLMSQIDRWVVGEVLRILKDNLQIKIFINISGISLGDKALLDYIEHTIKASNIEPARLGFEITESTAVKDLAQAERWIRSIKELGCQFALDDFGVGFSSFAYLKNLPVDYLKIDGSFVRDVDLSDKQRLLIRAIANIADALGKETIAEYIENEKVYNVLKELQINCGQGFYLGKPGPLE